MGRMARRSEDSPHVRHPPPSVDRLPTGSSPRAAPATHRLQGERPLPASCHARNVLLDSARFENGRPRCRDTFERNTDALDQPRCAGAQGRERPFTRRRARVRARDLASSAGAEASPRAASDMLRGPSPGAPATACGALAAARLPRVCESPDGRRRTAPRRAGRDDGDDEPAACGLPTRMIPLVQTSRERASNVGGRSAGG